MKNLKAIRIINIVLIIITTLLILWMTNTPGFPGLCRWNPLYLKITRAFWLFNLLNIVVFSGSFFLKSKKAKSILSQIAFILALVYALGFIVLGIFLIYPQFTKPSPEYQLNEMTQKTKFEKHTEGLFLRIAVSSDPHFGAGTNSLDVTTQILKTIKAENYDAFFCLGDISELGILE
ncbi:MAG: hypothetical protein BKP49_06455 [Treponema sp. CETP13]|nr:MAG: hypothetical protein BKP49_06455 [Treponema sp. CETP13]